MFALPLLTILLHATAFLLALVVAHLSLTAVRLDRGGTMVTIIALASYTLFWTTLTVFFRPVMGQ